MSLAAAIAPLVCALSLVVAGADQARPNFSGNWTLVAPDGSAGIMFLGMAFTAEQDEKTLMVTPTLHQIHRGERPEQLKASFNLDGSESKNPFDIHAGHGQTGTRISRVTWDADRLVIATSTTGINGLTQTQTWSFDASGNLIVDAVLLTARGETTSSKVTYKKADLLNSK
jgi:hypothetical protein